MLKEVIQTKLNQALWFHISLARIYVALFCWFLYSPIYQHMTVVNLFSFTKFILSTCTEKMILYPSMTFLLLTGSAFNSINRGHKRDTEEKCLLLLGCSPDRLWKLSGYSELAVNAASVVSVTYINTQFHQHQSLSIHILYHQAPTA